MWEPPETFNIADYFLVDRLRDGDGERAAVRTDDATFTYAEINRLANRFGNALRTIGVRQEERVLVALPDGPAYAAAIFGILKLGAVVVMINPSQPADQLAALLDDARAPVAVAHARTVAAFEEAGRAARRSPRLLVVGDPGDVNGPTDGDGAGTDHVRFDDLEPDLEPDLDVVPTHRDDPAIWLFSGGSTGRPKAVVQTHTSYANSTECYAKNGVGYGPDDMTISVPKLHFGYATGSNLLFPFAVGASCVLFDEHPTAAVLFEKIARHRPTIIVNVPSMIAQMLDHEHAPEQDLSCVRFATSAGEALPPALYDRWKATFGAELYDGLGTAEQWHIFVSNLPGQVRPGTVGKAVPGFDIAVRDADGRDLEPGEVGQLWVRGNSRAIAYWQNMPKTKETFVGEWVITGDLVSRDEDGWVTYVGRGDSAMKVKGKWFVPAELEGVLLEHDAVAGCAVVGIEDEDGLLKPVAFVVLEEGAATDRDGLEKELQELALDRLEAYKHPRQVFVVEDFPRTHLGKVDRRALKSSIDERS